MEVPGIGWAFDCLAAEPHVAGDAEEDRQYHREDGELDHVVLGLVGYQLCVGHVSFLLEGLSGHSTR